MNTGAFGENFPYSNFHDLNMDWIIQIAKNFLDQYTHLQETITNGEESLQNLTTSGLEQLQTKADDLEALLQAWYDTHSADIANQLADALEDLNTWYETHSEDIANQLTASLNTLNSQTESKIANFNARAEAKTQELLQTIPADYSELGDKVKVDHNRLNQIQKDLSTIIATTEPVENGFYNKSTGAFSSTTAFQHKTIPCKEGDLFIVSSTWGGTANVVNFYNGTPSADTYLGLYEIHSDTEDLIRSNELMVVAPSLATYAVFNNATGNAFRVDRAIENTLNVVDIQLNTGFYKADNGEYYATAEWKHAIIPVKTGETYFISCEYGGTGHYALFYNGTPSVATFVGYPGTRTGINDPLAIAKDIEVTIPIGVTHLVVNGYIMDGIGIMVRQPVYNNYKTPVYYIWKNSKLYAISKYDQTHDLIVLMEQKGNNNLFDFHSFMLSENTDQYPAPATTGTILSEHNTDMTSPYKVRAVNNIDGDAPNSHWFTGGNHAYNTNNYSGTPNARTTMMEVYADGKPILNGEGYCTHLQVKWTNLVQAYNTEKADGTGREVLLETHIAEFDGIEWKIYGEFIALEDIVVELFYGSQLFQLVSVYPNIRFIGGTNRYRYTAEVNTDLACGDLTCEKLIAFNDHHMAELLLDGSFDLGKRTHNENPTMGMFVSSQKAYMGLIMGELPVRAYQLYAYRGAYRFHYYVSQI